MSWGMVAGGAMSLVGSSGILGGGDDGMDDYMDMIAAASRKAEQEYKPYTEAGTSALGQYQAQLGLGGEPAFDVTTLPGYQGMLGSRLDAVNQAAAGGGMTFSGQRLQDAAAAGSDVFGGYYSDYMNRLQGLQGQGMSAVGNLANIRMGGAGQMAQMGMQQAGQQGAMMGDLLGVGASILGSSLPTGQGGVGAPSTGTPAGGGGSLNLSSMMDTSRIGSKIPF